MAGRDNLHSSLVSLLKVALPLGGLVLLSTLFLVSRSIDPSDAIPFADVDVEERAREPRMTTPDYAGVTTDGAALTVSAAEVRPSSVPGGDDTALALTAALETPDGVRSDLTAAAGFLDSGARVLLLRGDVQVANSAGYRVRSEEMTAGLVQTDIRSPGPVQVSSPMGDLSAGSMSLTQDPDDPSSYLLVFKNGVKLLYAPR